MKRRVRVGGLLLALGGWCARLGAQDAVWRAIPAPRPLPAIVTAAEPGAAAPVAVLGRPIVIATSRPVPPATAGSPPLMLVSHQTGDAGAPPTASEPPGPPPAWPNEDDDAAEPDLTTQVGLFASERDAATAAAAGAEVTPVVGAVRDEVEAALDAKGTLGKGPAFLPSHGYPDAVDGPMPDPLHCHFFAKAEYLLWGVRPFRTPPLVTTGSAADAVPGAIGQPHTQVLFGNSDLAGGLRSGLRLTVGGWFDMWEECGFEASGFFLGEKTNHFTTNTAENAVIARPFFELNRNMENAQLVSFPGLSTGAVTARATSRLFGAEANYRGKWCCGCDYRVDVLAGFRFLDLDEDLRVTETIFFSDSPALGPAPNQGDLRNQTATAFDDFHTRNRFYGGQVGVVGEKRWGPWSLEGRFKLALGVNAEEVDINGAQQFVPNSAINARGDLLALASNIGSRERSRFCVVPEVDLNIGYQVTPNLRAFIGYDLLYWSTVVRPGDQIDRVLDVTTVPNFALLHGQTPLSQARPVVPFKESGFWAQGLNVGIEFRY
jgi:hypothetical protein